MGTRVGGRRRGGTGARGRGWRTHRFMIVGGSHPELFRIEGALVVLDEFINYEDSAAPANHEYTIQVRGGCWRSVAWPVASTGLVVVHAMVGCTEVH